VAEHQDLQLRRSARARKQPHHREQVANGQEPATCQRPTGERGTTRLSRSWASGVRLISLAGREGAGSLTIDLD